MSELKSFPANFTELMANGHKYKPSKSIAPIRYKEYEKLVPALTFGLSFQNIYQQLGKLFTLLNGQQFANAAVVCHNIMNGIKTIDDENRIHPALEMCALVINRENEDPSVYDRDLMLAKIEDWQKEGLDMTSFFRFALSTIEGFREELISSTKESLQDLSAQISKQ